MPIQDFDYLKRDWNDIALAITEDVFGMHGDLTDNDVLRRLGNKISESGHVRNGWVRLIDVEQLIFDVWAHKEKELETAGAKRLGLPLDKEDFSYLEKWEGAEQEDAQAPETK